MGFCMGGMYTLKAAADPVFDKAVSFYGMIRVPEQWRGPGQGEPLQILRERKARHVLAIIGTDDPWVSVYDGEDLRALGAEVVVYEGAEHGFVHDPERPAHRPDDAADAWRRAREWLLG
jgi:carboxymethylenebutenolidase